MRIKVKYFAVLREEADRNDEEITDNFSNAFELYQFLRSKYQFSLTDSEIKVAINGEYQDFKTQLKDGDIITFIPPVAGG
jgi:molybdopterin synthase sulfur carrier subunit